MAFACATTPGPTTVKSKAYDENGDRLSDRNFRLGLRLLPGAKLTLTSIVVNGALHCSPPGMTGELSHEFDGAGPVKGPSAFR